MQISTAITWRIKDLVANAIAVSEFDSKPEFI